MIFEICFVILLIVVACCWDSPWDRFDLNVRPISQPFVRFGLFALSILLFFLIWGNSIQDSMVHHSFYRYIAGVFIVIFAKGPRIGSLHPISTRGIMVFIGLVIILTSIFPILGR